MRDDPFVTILFAFLLGGFVAALAAWELEKEPRAPQPLPVVAATCDTRDLYAEGSLAQLAERLRSDEARLAELERR